MVCAADIVPEQQDFPRHALPAYLRPALKELHEGTGVPYPICVQYAITYMAASRQNFLDVSRNYSLTRGTSIFSATVTENGKPFTALKNVLPMPKQKSVRKNLVCEAWDGDDVLQKERISEYKTYTQSQAISFFTKYPRISARTLWHKQSSERNAPIKSDYKMLELFKQRIHTIATENQRMATVCLSDKAFSIWRDFYDETESKIGKSGEFSAISANICFIAENAARIAALFSVFCDNGSLLIDDYEMDCACKIAQWHIHEAMKIFAPQQ